MAAPLFVDACGARNVRLPTLRNNSAEKWRPGCQIYVFQDPADPAFSGAAVVGSEFRRCLTG